MIQLVAWRVATRPTRLLRRRLFVGRVMRELRQVPGPGASTRPQANLLHLLLPPLL